MTKEEYERAVAESIQSQLSPGNMTKELPAVDLFVQRRPGQSYNFPVMREKVDRLEKLVKCLEHGFTLDRSPICEICGADSRESPCNPLAHRHAEVKRVHPTGCPCVGCTTPRGGFEFL